MTNPISEPLVENVMTEDVASRVLIEGAPDGSVTLTINRPARRNALDAQTVVALTEAFETLHGADHVRVVFLTGAGAVFCSGGDLESARLAAEDWTEADNLDDARAGAAMFRALREVPALTVALLNGPAVGAGAGLTAACDAAVAVSTARIDFAETRRGFVPSISAPYVIEALGLRQARALLVAGRDLSAEEALRIGLVQEVAPDAAGLAAARDRIAAAMSRTAPGAAREAKSLLQNLAGRGLDADVVEETARAFARSRTSAEGREGVLAFLQKRRPEWAAD